MTRQKPRGEIRQSQLITTFGPGAMLDLPEHSVLVAGLDFWTTGGETIVEPRLSQKLARVLNLPSIELRTPPPAENDPTAPARGIYAFQFPEWFITQNIERSEESKFQTRLLVHRKSLVRGKFVDRDRRSHPVVPIRFVRACTAGHIGDIDWYDFVHSGKSDCASQGRQLYIDERGTSGDLNEVWVRCECGKAERSMAQAGMMEMKALRICDGARPWLGPHSAEICGAPSRLLIRSASNAYFPQLMSVISLPERDQELKVIVDKIWSDLEQVTGIDELKYERKKAKIKEALEGFSDEEVLAEIQSRRNESAKDQKPVKVAELETLVAAKAEVGNDRPDGIFYARALPNHDWESPWMLSIERIVLVHRLREVVAQVGFTRIESAAPDMDGELDLGVKRASLAREPKWLPAYENKGEGIFIQFKKDAILAWLSRPGVQKRALELVGGFKQWGKEHPGASRKFPELAYWMMHSFSHLLLTGLALSCGYPASSLRERIYAIPALGYGVLVYTGSSDTEGTLGGLVLAGRRIHVTVKNALAQGLLCSNDPVCAQHDPANTLERRFLHGSACHGCLLIPETSCEMQNDFLDRSLVVPTLEAHGAEFFAGAESA